MGKTKASALRKENDDINEKFSELISREEAWGLRVAVLKWAKAGLCKECGGIGTVPYDIGNQPCPKCEGCGGNKKLDRALLAAARRYAKAYEGR